MIAKINEVPHLHNWLAVVVAFTSLSDPQPLKKNDIVTISRDELAVYRELVRRQSELLRLPTFGDYGIEYEEDLKPIVARPAAKMNYSTPEGYFYAKGDSIKKFGYGAIFPVADMVASSPGFQNEAYSPGDQHIRRMSRREVTTGNAPKWRWATANHHVTQTINVLASELSVAMETVEPTTTNAEPDLFAIFGAGDKT